MYQMPEIDELGLTHAFSTIQHGNMSFRYKEKKDKGAVLKNREKFLERLGISLHSWISLDECVAMQTGNNNDIPNHIQMVNRYNRGSGMQNSKRTIQADCLIVQEKDVFLWLVTADCLPVIFFSRNPFVLALAHISRKNSALGFSSEIVRFLRRLKVKPEELFVAVGPSIKKESYLFERRNLWQADEPEWQPFIQETAEGLLSVDLLGFNIKQLKSAGVLEKNIFASGIDTAKSEMFFSHRRSVKENLSEARFASVVGVKEAKK